MSNVYVDEFGQLCYDNVWLNTHFFSKIDINGIKPIYTYDPKSDNDLVFTSLITIDINRKVNKV